MGGRARKLAFLKPATGAQAHTWFNSFNDSVSKLPSFCSLPLCSHVATWDVELPRPSKTSKS